MKTNFITKSQDLTGAGSDLGDLFIPRALFSSGGLWIWGQNAPYGMLGNNTTVNNSSPVQTIAASTNWKQVGSGTYSTGAIKTDGTLWLWGWNSYGQLGDNTTSNKSSPVQTIAAGTNWKLVSCGQDQTAAIKTDGTLWLWGRGIAGQLGDNTIVGKSSPVQTIAAGANWQQISSGDSFIGAIKTDGTLWTWGSNAFGQLGDNTTVSKSSPIQTISGGTNWNQVASGGNSIGAIKSDGTLWTWGYNAYGQLGDNTIVWKSSPIQTIAGGTNWKQVSCHFQMVAIKTNGTLWTWGRNVDGDLGDNTTSNKSSPVQTIAGGTNWKLAACGNYISAAIKTDGTLWTWGNDIYGALGDGTPFNKSSPVQTMAAGTNWKQVSAGSYRIVGIRDDY